MKFFDSNFWIAYFDRNDRQHDKAVELFKKQPNFAITEYCVLETSSILAIKRGKSAAADFLSHVKDNADVTIVLSSPTFFDETVSLFQETDDRKLSFVDISLLLLSESHDVITFDKTLTRAIKAQRKK